MIVNAAQALTITAAAALLLTSSRRPAGLAEAGEGDFLGGWDPLAIVDRGESLFHQVTEQAADVSGDTAAANIAAFLYALRQAEGTEGQANAYAVCFGYRHTVKDFTDHPAITGEWRGEPLSDGMCRNAGFSPGCVSSAAGAYQLIKPTWRRVRDALGLADFSPASQDAAARDLVRQRGALEDVKAGNFRAGFIKCRNEWASLPGNYARQGQRSHEQLALWVFQAGGITA